MRLFVLFIAVLLFVPFAPLAQANHANTIPNVDVWNQVFKAQASAGVNSCTLTQVGVAVTVGQEYVVTSGVYATSATNLKGTIVLGTGSTTQNLIAVDVRRDGTLANIVGGTDPVLLRHENHTISGGTQSFSWAVSLTVPSGYTHLFVGCGGGDSNTALGASYVQNSQASDLIGLQGQPSLQSGGTIVGSIFRTDIALLGEAGILAGQTNTANIVWNQVNSGVTIGEVGFTTVVSDYRVQSFKTNADFGRYVELSNGGFRSTASCSGTVWMSIATALSYPWDTTKEVGNMTATFTLNSASVDFDLNVDWLGGAISSTNPNAVFGTPTFHDSDGPTATVSRVPFVGETTGVTYYLKTHFSNPTCINTMVHTGNPYAGGTSFRPDPATSSFIQELSNDLRFVLKVYSPKTMKFYHNTTPETLGGAHYVYLREVHSTGTSEQQVSIISTYGGAARPIASIGTVPLGEDRTLYRLGYQDIPWTNSTQQTHTWTLTNLGRGIVYAGTLTTQPPHPNIGTLTFPGDGGKSFVGYQLLSTDDYRTTASFRVKECADVDCKTLNETFIPNASYVAIINPGAVGSRTFGGVSDANGYINVSGQDVFGAVVQITLTKLGYQKAVWSASVKQTGTTTFNIGMAKTITGAGDATFGGVSVTWTGGPTFVIPSTANLTATRSGTKSVIIDCWKLLPASGGVANACKAYYWPDAGDTHAFVFPQDVRTSTTLTDAGQYYVLAVDPDTGKGVGGYRFCIGPTDPVTCNAPVSQALIDTLASDAINEAVSRALEDERLQEALVEESVHRKALNALDFAFDDSFFTIPNIAWWYLGTLVVAIGGIGFRHVRE